MVNVDNTKEIVLLRLYYQVSLFLMVDSDDLKIPRRLEVKETLAIISLGIGKLFSVKSQGVNILGFAGHTVSSNYRAQLLQYKNSYNPMNMAEVQ